MSRGGSAAQAARRRPAGDGLIRIRAAREDDLAALPEIERAAGQMFRALGMDRVADDDPGTADELRPFVANGRAWVAVDDADAPVGYAIAHVVDGAAHLEQVSVHPGWARRGIGRQLLEQVVDWAVAHQLPAVTLTTFTDVPWNGPYYRRLGFDYLDPQEEGPGLRAARERERRNGLDEWPRAGMRRELTIRQIPHGTAENGAADTSPVRPDGRCPLHIRRAVMRQRWEHLTFLHWRYPASVVQQLVPAGLSVETYDGTGWVGLIPFVMNVSLPRLAYPPWLGRFPETNVRTYVRDRHGRPGIWFFSLDAARLPAVATARAVYRLPYFWSSMAVDRRAEAVRYTASRRRPHRRAASDVDVRLGAPYRPGEIDPLTHFLTARWRLFSQVGTSLSYVEAEHPPWPLRRATVADIEDSLVTAAGLPPPRGDALVHHSRGVDVRLGPPHRVR